MRKGTTDEERRKTTDSRVIITRTRMNANGKRKMSKPGRGEVWKGDVKLNLNFLDNDEFKEKNRILDTLKMGRCHADSTSKAFRVERPPDFVP
jgi:hypothetical protein